MSKKEAIRNENILVSDIEDLLNQTKNKVVKLQQLVIEKENEFDELQEQITQLKKKQKYYNYDENTNKIKALNIFNSIEDFDSYVKDLYNVKNWTIRAETYKERATILKKYDYFNAIKEEFESKKLVNRKINDDQVVSFFDTLYLMRRVLEEITDVKLKNEMKIIMEYVIPTPEKDRVDYMLVYRDSILLVEFSKASSINTLNSESDKKHQKLETYIQKVKMSINTDRIKVNGIVFMYLDETTDSNLSHNDDSIVHLKKKITSLLLENNKNAFEFLCDIE